MYWSCERLDRRHLLNKCFDKGTRSKALGIRKPILSFGFFLFLYRLWKVLCTNWNILGTEILEAKNLCIIDGITVIGSTVKMLTEINSDDHAMKNLINSAKEFANSLGTDSEADFKSYHRKILTPKRFYCNALPLIEFTMHLFNRKELKLFSIPF